MKKQVILTEQEYEKFLTISSVACQILDEYTLKENSNPKLDRHITDSVRCNPLMKQLYAIFLYLPDEVQEDIRHKMGLKYFEKKVGQQSVLNDSMDEIW
jgi:hypothetical protein